MGEFEFIDKIKEAFEGIASVPGMEGIGDDCAVIPMGEGRSMVITTDMLLEGQHFLRGAASAYEIGRKSLAVNLSDVAAMGARPVATLLSIGLPTDCVGEWADGFMAGYRELSGKYGVALIGGDTTASECSVAINVVAIGMTANGHIKRRSSARVGDLVCVAGRLGESAAGLRSVLAGDWGSPLARAHYNPEPQVLQGQWLGAQPGVHAMIDLSDGLASDLGHVLKASGLGARIELNDIPTDYALEDALAGGEDYKLLFTIDRQGSAQLIEAYRRQFGELYVIGEAVGGPARIVWMRGSVPVAGNWEGFRHF